MCVSFRCDVIYPHIANIFLGGDANPLSGVWPPPPRLCPFGGGRAGSWLPSGGSGAGRRCCWLGVAAGGPGPSRLLLGGGALTIRSVINGASASAGMSFFCNLGPSVCVWFLSKFLLGFVFFFFFFLFFFLTPRTVFTPKQPQYLCWR